MGDTDVIRKHIEIVDGINGPKARIAGSRIRVLDVVSWHLRQGITVQEMLENFPTVTEADIYAALAYYCDNRAEIEAEFAAIDRVWEKYPPDQTSPLQQEWKRRRDGGG